VCCNTLLYCVAVCYNSVLQCVAVRHKVFRSVAVFCNVLQCVAVVGSEILQISDALGVLQ